MFIKKTVFDKLLLRIAILEEKICPNNSHDYVIIDEYTASDYNGGQINTWTKRILQCTKCNKRIKDGSPLGFKYKAKYPNNKGGCPDEKITRTVSNDLRPEAAVPEGQIDMFSFK